MTMKKKLSSKEYIYVASMLFGLFFGAGNLIFPVSMGQQAGSQVWITTLGFLITGVGLPLLGVIPEDRKVPVANAKGELLVTQQSRGAARGYENIAQRLCGKRVPIGWK